MPLMLSINESPLNTLVSLLDEMSMEVQRLDSPVFMLRNKQNLKFLNSLKEWAMTRYPHAVYRIGREKMEGYVSAPDWLLLKYYAHLATERMNDYRKDSSNKSSNYLSE